jgi:hypothetical protein
VQGGQPFFSLLTAYALNATRKMLTALPRGEMQSGIEALKIPNCQAEPSRANARRKCAILPGLP